MGVREYGRMKVMNRERSMGLRESKAE